MLIVIPLIGLRVQEGKPAKKLWRQQV